MSYSCSDFTDDVLEALSIDLDDGELDAPDIQANYCLNEISRLQSFEAEVREALAEHQRNPNAPLLISRLVALVKPNA